MDGNEGPCRFSPDGLAEPLIDVLLQEVDAALADAPRPTSALVDGSAAERRRRRVARRAVASVVRALPVHHSGSPDGWAA